MAIGLYTTAWVTLFSIAYSGDFLGANVGLAILFMVAAAIPFYVCTSMLASALPRAGGDYVWQSRILHPAIGFAVTLSAWTIWQWYFASYFGNLVVTLGLQPWLALMGSTGNTSYQNLSTTLGANYGLNPSVFELTTLLIILGFIVAGLGMKFYVRLQYVLFAGSVISAVTLLGVMATTSHAQFVTSFNSFTLPLVQSGGNQTFTNAVTSAGGYYQYIMSVAGIHAPAFNLYGTLLLMAIVWSSFGYAFWSIYNLSEIKKAGSLRTQSWIQIGSALSFAVFLLLLWFLLEHTVGVQFLQSFYSLYYLFDPSTNPLAFFYTPYYPALIASISTSPVVWTLILLGLTFGVFQVILIVYFASTRIMLAASLDRVLPEKISYVNPRTHSPLVALVISAIGCEAFLYLIIYQPSDTGFFSTAAMGAQIAYIMISVTAIAFPFRMKAAFDASPVGKYKLGSIPLLSVMGCVALVVNLWIAYVYVAGPALGYLNISSSSSLELVVSVLIGCFLLYAISWGVRRSQGIDLSLSFKEMPPE